VRTLAATIKGINIQLGFETKALDAALKDVNEKSRDITKELREVEKLLKFDPHNTELLAQKQQLLSEQVSNTAEKLNRLKDAQTQVNEQFQKGEIDADQYRAFQRELEKTESQLKNYEKQLKTATTQKEAFVQKTQELSDKLSKVGDKLEGVGKKLSTHLTLPLAALGTLAAKSTIDFESAFAGVRKTVDASEEEFATLEQGIRDMVKEIPAAATEIAGVAEAAGQLGIATENILEFSRTMIDLGESTNLSADEAATALARLANITQMSQTDFDRLGSTIVALGNNLATTEAEIVDMSLRLAGAGKQVGLTEAEILSLAGALSSVGIAADAGGSAFSKVMTNMQLAVETGGEALDNFAAVAGVPAVEFAQAFNDDAAGALIAFIEGLQETENQGVSAIKVLDDMGITEVRMRDALLRAAGAGDLFNQAIEIGTKAWEENTALTTEAAQRYETTASKLEIMRNQLQDVAITFGEILLPVITSVAEKIGVFAEWLNGLDPAIKNIIVSIGVLAVVIGPLLKVVGLLVNSGALLIKYIPMISGFIKTSLIPAITGISAPALATVAAIVALITVAYEIYNAWDEVKEALLAIWDLIKLGAERLSLWMNYAWELIKYGVFTGVDAVLQKLSLLEHIPYIGEAFKNLKNMVSDSAQESAESLAALSDAMTVNSAKMADAVDRTKVAFGDLGYKVAEDMRSAMRAITGTAAVTSVEAEQQLAATLNSQELQTEAFEAGAIERAHILAEEVSAEADILAEGMENAINAWLEAGYDKEDDIDALGEFIAKELGDYIVGQSPPPEGPLSEVDEGGKRIIESWSEGLLKGIPAVERAAKIVALVTEKALNPAEKFKNQWKNAANEIGRAFERLGTEIGEMWLTKTGSWEEILLNFVSTAIDQILTAAIGAMGIAELVSQALSQMWNPAGWIVIAGLLAALAALQAGLQAKLKDINGIPPPTTGGGGSGSTGGGLPFKGGGGAQISEITGPTRDLLVDLLKPLANLNSIVSPIHDIRDILNTRLPNLGSYPVASTVGGAEGYSVNVSIQNFTVSAPTTGVNDVAEASINKLEQTLAQRLLNNLRGRGQ
jgi:TP901 family phage tail tape measure protein